MNSPLVSLSKGKIQGKWIAKGALASFKGIPYAEPPVGELRWRPPQPVKAWDGVRMATKFRAFPWQQEVTFPYFIDALVEGQGWPFLRRNLVKSLFKIVPRPRQSEDCLYLNIKTPTLDRSANLPVMVWIHGGDHQDGSAAEPFYDGTAIPMEGVVFVSINYRLGLMGYFAHPELKAESEHGVAGNYGTLDQIEALKWVQSHIADFGGNPDNVTIFGESAGGESVLHMLVSPLAKGLFHRAIAQSPANAGQQIYLDKPSGYCQSADDFSVAFSRRMGIKGDNQLTQLRNMPAKALMTHLRQDKDYNAFYPVIDGYVLPKNLVEAFRDHDFANVPVIIGSNADEGTCIYPIFRYPVVSYRHLRLNKKQVRAQLEQDFGSDVEELYRFYPGLENGDPSAEIAMLGDEFFGTQARLFAQYVAESGQPAFLYSFQRTPPSPSQTAGAFHGAELPFVHGTNTPILPLNENDMALSRQMIQHWVHFAKTGNPNYKAGPTWESFNGRTPKWMTFDIQGSGMEPVSREAVYQILIRFALSKLGYGESEPDKLSAS